MDDNGNAIADIELKVGTIDAQTNFTSFDGDVTDGTVTINSDVWNGGSGMVKITATKAATLKLSNPAFTHAGWYSWTTISIVKDSGGVKNTVVTTDVVNPNGETGTLHTWNAGEFYNATVDVEPGDVVYITINGNEWGAQISKNAIQVGGVAKPSIAYNNLTLDGVLGVNFKVDMTGIDPTGYTMEITVGNDAEPQVVTAAGTENIEGVNCHVFTGRVMAHRMMETITAKLYDANGNCIDTTTFNTEDYVAAANSAAGTSAEMKGLLDDMLVYSKYAASIKGGQIADLPTVELGTSELADLNSFAFTAETTATDIMMAAIWDEACNLQFKLPTAAYQGYTVSVTKGTAPVTPEKTVEGEYDVYTLSALAAQDWDTAYTFEVKNASTSETVYKATFSVMSYVQRCLVEYPELVSAELQNLMKAAYYYNVTADAYLAAQ